MNKTLEMRKIPIPLNRMSPLRENWLKIYTPLTDHLKLQVRMNVQKRMIEIRQSPESDLETVTAMLQKAEDFVKAFALGFDADDAISLLRTDGLFVVSFHIKDVKNLTGDHLSRAIGRIAGNRGKTKHAIENATKTRVVLADTKVHILGSYQNTKMAKSAIVSLILGSPAGSVYNDLQVMSSRLKERL